MSYSSDMRRRALELSSRGMKKTEIGEVLGIHRQTIQRWFREGCQGKNEPDKPGPRRNRIVPEDALKAAIKARPDARLIELADQFGVHPSTISKALKRLRITRKKNVALH